MFKKVIYSALAITFVALTACNESVPTVTEEGNDPFHAAGDTVIVTEGETNIVLSDAEITVNGEIISGDPLSPVYMANDIIYYEKGQGAAYGEGTEADAHSAEEADAHTVIHITEAGIYRISGKLSRGQILVDLGDAAKNDPSAVVTLVLDGADITCTVAPAIFFYNVYECGNTEEADATAFVDTSTAGANVILADGSTNHVNGAYVARIYKPQTTEKLHKYDAAFYSRRSINIGAGATGTGTLCINATNEGLGSEMHLTVNGGNISILSQDDGINTNEDNISVTTVNGGKLTINAGLGAEGDAIDSNGFIVINGGSVYLSANERSPDSGLDADRDILINGGTVIACGNMNSNVSRDSRQMIVQHSVLGSLPAGSEVRLMLKDDALLSFTVQKAFSSLLISTPSLVENVTYTLVTAADADKTEVRTDVYATKPSAFSGGFGQFPGEFNEKPPQGFDDRRPVGGDHGPFGQPPEGLDEWLESAEIPEDIRAWIENMRDIMQQKEIRRDTQFRQ